MPLFNAHKGSWGGLPDFGVTEFIGQKLGRGTTAQGGSNVINSKNYAQTPTTAQPAVLGPNTQQYGMTPSPYGMTSNPAYSPSPFSGGGGSAGPVGSPQPAGNPILEQNINREVGDLGSIIDRDFESALAEYATQEQNLRGTADVATQNVNAQAAQSRTALQNQQSTALQGIQKEEQTAQTQSSNAIQQARDLNRQIERQNIAQLSSLGISSSSVAEALAERLGVETARRIAGVTGSRDEIFQNLQSERTRINNVATQKLADLEQSVGAQISEIQNNLLSGIRQINTARDTAARDKVNRRAELLSNAQSEIARLRASAAEFSQQLQMAAQRRQASVNESLNLLTASPADFSNLVGNVNAIAPGLQQAGLQFNTVSPSGNFTIGPARISKDTGEAEEDEDGNLY